MKVYKFNIPSGTLEVCILEERPTSFSTSRERRAYLYPSEGCDLECVLTEGEDVLTRASLDLAAALSYLLGSVRGIPEDALSIGYEGRLIDLPKLCTPPGVVDVPLPICKYIFTKNEYFEGGIPEPLTTVSTPEVSRIVLASPTSPYPMPLLRRSRIARGMPDAVRAIAYFADGDCYRAISTDRHESADSIAPLAYVLLRDREAVTIKTRRGEYNFLKIGDVLIFRCPVEVAD